MVSTAQLRLFFPVNTPISCLFMEKCHTKNSIPKKQLWGKKIQLEGQSTTTKGNFSEGRPPGGIAKPPFARYGTELMELLELEPFPIAFKGSTFMSEIFLTFFS